MEKDKKILEKGEFPIKVSRDIVSHLSVGLYRNFARAVKELISNAYDAGATEVKIKLDLESTPTKIIVRDNGHGMDKEDIKNKFLNIGFPTPLTEEIDKLGRKRIGTFGIGCISVFPYCKIVRVITKKSGSDNIIEVTINAERYFIGGTFDIGKEKVPYESFASDLPKEKGETIIILEDIKRHIINELKHKESSGKSSIDKFGGFQKFKWSLSQYIPIQFPSYRKDLKDFFEDSNKVLMRVWVNGEELFRNVPENAKILEKGEKKFNGIQVKYVIMTPIEPIKPGEAKGFQIRLRDVAIGLPTDFNIISLTGKVPGKLNWICGEIHILEGLTSSLMIDRDNFSFTQEVAEIHDFFREKIRKWNDNLEKWAKEDKDVYESIHELKGSEKVIDELKNGGVLRISKERLRIPKSPIVKHPEKELSSPTEKISKILSKRGYKILHKKGKVSDRKLSIEVIPEKKSIVIYEDHPDFVETIKIREEEFRVGYDKWDYKKGPYSICRLIEDQNKVVFNILHPLFKSKLHEDILKQLSLGILIITKDRKDREELVEKIYRLLEDIFLG